MTEQGAPQRDDYDAAVKLYEIAASIRGLEGLPVAYGLARELSSVLNWIESSVDRPKVAAASLPEPKVEQGAPQQRKEASRVAPPYAAIDKLLTDRFGWPWKPEIQTLYAGICDLFDKPVAAASLPESQPRNRYTMTFLLSSSSSVLLLLKPKTHHNPLFRDRWTAPGGLVEQGESDIDSACRELREETGIVAPPNSLVHVMTFPCNCDAAEGEHDVVVFGAISESLGAARGDEKEPVREFDILPSNTIWYVPYVLPLVNARLGLGTESQPDHPYARYGCINNGLSQPSPSGDELLWEFMEPFIGPTGGWLVSPKKFHAAIADWLRAHDAKGQEIAATAYQCLGAARAPVRVLDYFSAAQRGKPLPENPLPVAPEEFDAKVGQAEQRLRDVLHGLVQHFRNDFEDPGLELYGLVNGKELCAGGQMLNKLLAEAEAALKEPR